LSGPILQVWSAPKCETGAVPIAALPAVTYAQIVETINGADSGTITIPADVARASGVAAGRIVRAIVPLRGVQEWVITSVRDDDAGARVSVTLGPLRHLLALRGFVRTTQESATTLAFVPGPQTVSQLITQYVLTNLDADGLSWLSLGTMEYTELLTLASFSASRRGEILTAIESATGYDVVLRRLTDDAGYAIDVLASRGSTLPTLLVEAPSAISITRTRDLTQTATAVLPIGGDGRPMGEVDWTGGVASGAGPYWIPLTDPTGGPSPIWEDDQFVGAYLALPGGTALLITDSRSSDSAVQVASLGAYATGQRVVLWENTNGRPVSLIRSPAAIASAQGLVVARASVKGARSERTLNTNGGFETNATEWTISSGAAAELPRDAFPLTLTGAANGARAALTGTGTPMPVNGFPASAWLRRGDRLVVDGVTLTVTADAVPDATGAITLTITPALPATYADDTPFSLERVDVRALQIEGTQTYAAYLAGSRTLTFKDVNTDNLAVAPTVDGALTTLTHTPSAGGFTGGPWGYVSGNAGLATLASTGFYGTPPASFTDGDACVLTIPRETRTLRLNGSHASGATTLVFKFVTALARRDWTTSDTVYVRRALTGTALMTAYNAGTGVATITTGSSTLDDVASGDRDGLARLSIPDANIVPDLTYGGTPYPSGSEFPYLVSGIAGSAMTLSLDVDTIAAISGGSVTVNSLTDGGGWPLTRTASWAVVDSYAVTAGVSWGSNGRAAVPISIPSGRTITRGEKLYSNWVGGGSAGAETQGPTPLLAHATVTGVASSVTVAGSDRYTASWDGVTSETTGVYRVFGGTGTSRFVVGTASEVVVGTSVQLNGSGAGSVTLYAANTDTIASGAVLTITRPALLMTDDRTTGSGLRLMYAPSTPTFSTPYAQSAPWTIVVPTGYPRVVRGVATINVRPGSSISPGSVAVALVDLTRGVLLASGTVAGTTTPTALTRITLSVTAELASTALVALRVYGGSDGTFTVWHYLTAAWLYVAPDTDDADIAFADGARSRLAFHRGQSVLAQRKGAARYAVGGIDLAALEASGTPVQIGQSVRIRSPALDLDTTERIVGLTWRWPGAELVDMECAALAPRLTDVEVSA
jgi:hypothetical protein